MADTKPSNVTLIAKIIDHVIAPFYRTGSTGSFGRLWASILIALMSGRFWIFPKIPSNPPDSMVNITLALLAYVFGSKGLDIYRDVKSGVLSSKPAAEIKTEEPKEEEKEG
jgi:hypothetical protein